MATYAAAESTASVKSETQNHKTDWFEQFLQELGASEQIDVSQGIDWGVLPGPFASPEKGLGFGVAAVGLYAPHDWQNETPYSTLSVKSFVSTSGAYGLGFENRTYLKQDTLRLLGDVWLSHEPTYYWGQGRAAAQNDANKTKVTAQILKLTPRISYQFLPETYLTLGWDYEAVSEIDVDEGSALAPNQQHRSQASGTLIALEYDSRDFEPNPNQGRLLSAEWVAYRQGLGSDHDFDRMTLNYREYWPLSAERVLAWDIFGQGVTGDVPWYGMSKMGSDRRMRGYYVGQYRDHYQLNAQIELRQHLNGRHGVVAWLGAGQIAPNFAQLWRETWLPTVGVGYRFAFKPRINVRFDFGMGKESSGFYFHINEAF
ncbi:BamA/TamA family outer membrane protein [Vibrio stylophorae]|nr:BamA/TamA family outer membrane protein [Vibrio stylophorae]